MSFVCFLCFHKTKSFYFCFSVRNSNNFTLRSPPFCRCICFSVIAMFVVWGVLKIFLSLNISKTITWTFYESRNIISLFFLFDFLWLCDWVSWVFLDHNNNCIGHDKLIWHFHIILCSLNYFNISCYDIVNWIPVRTA